MNNEEKILELLQQMNARLDQMDARFEKLEANVEELKEGQEEIRDSVNVLIAWAEKVSKANEFPLPEVLGA